MSSIADILDEVAVVMNDGIKKEFAAQGHHLTGTFEDTMYNDIHYESLQGDAELIAYARSYGAIVNEGTSPDRIPFSGTNGDGTGTSAYIQGLVSFFKQRGFDDKTALSYAFATAKVQKQEGMSTAASARFSQTGQRQKFVEAAENTVHEKVDLLMINGIDEVIYEQSNEPLTIIY